MSDTPDDATLGERRAARQRAVDRKHTLHLHGARVEVAGHGESGYERVLEIHHGGSVYSVVLSREGKIGLGLQLLSDDIEVVRAALAKEDAAE